MHGLIHIVLKEFLVTQFGEEVWCKVLEKCSLPRDDTSLVDVGRQYEDKLTLTAIDAAFGILGVSRDAGLELFGAFFVTYLARQGWVPMLISMGSSLEEFINNLNEMHHFLERDLRSSVFPFFATSQDDQGCLLLTYSSARYLPGLVRGVLRELGCALYKVSVDFEEVCQDQASKSMTWRVRVSSLPCTAPAPEVESPEAPSPSLSFAAFHEMMVSLFRLPPISFGTCCATCNSEAEPCFVEEVSALPLQIPVKLEAADDDHDDRVADPSPTRSFHTSPLHSRIPSFRLTSEDSGGPTSLSSICAELSVKTPVSEWFGDLDAAQRCELAKRLLRAVPANKVSCSWQELGPASTSVTSRFWDQDLRLPEFFAWSVALDEAFLLLSSLFVCLSFCLLVVVVVVVCLLFLLLLLLLVVVVCLFVVCLFVLLFVCLLVVVVVVVVCWLLFLSSSSLSSSFFLNFIFFSCVAVVVVLV
ncbi:unnamed protein product [Polarella glacialis]|uniref:Heme NO-binding domain-containing protein n=1 Tax=Polarella glacialis TaxID=89957 RepID=A0A813K0B8_POLGL|nr:unnamed protein product [Polarella glacialis]